MEINLTTSQTKKEITNVRSQITNATTLRKFDEFVAQNPKFDFNNDAHLQALKKEDCHCTVTTTVPLTTKL
ncbi:hypothetical protein [Flavobacterium caeni]|uniref:Uncharacterized protein n=1 Tax=Flavobacterium caeni TaxID=490189 RepID=A0A1G5HTM6_9FLAO|nr:hypothetical protein [Flavobacterium caeni]SCY66640.1 hypothetical protein SAMN02927903_01981 [Flavobacterium caeni]